MKNDDVVPGESYLCTGLEWSGLLRRQAYKLLLVAISLILSHGLSSAAVLVEDFESFSDSDALTSQVTGLTFQNATILSAGVSLNEFEFPPQSGSNVVVDDGGAIAIDFGTTASSVSGYFTYLTQLTLEAFDAGSNLIATDLSGFITNTALSGDPGSSPNELLSVSSATGIARIVISGDPAGFSFVLDDLTVTTSGNANTVPEPGTLPLFFLASIAAGVALRNRAHLVS